MVKPKVFVGLVTHPKSTYTASIGPDGLLTRLAKSLTTQDVLVRTSIHDQDLYVEHMLTLSQAEVVASINTELDVEEQWRRHVNQDASQIKLKIIMRLRRAYRRMRFAPPWNFTPAATRQGGAMLRRLVNIELAHMSLLRQAKEIEATWALILEDDAVIEDVEQFAADLAHFVSRNTDEVQPKYVNVSRSFSASQLQIGNHLTFIGEWNSSVAELSARIPLSNTVCAILYRGSFLPTLIHALDLIPLSPVLPIDWKLNAALLDLSARSELGQGDCWFLNPAPIVQGSMS